MKDYSYLKEGNAEIKKVHKRRRIIVGVILFSILFFAAHVMATESVSLSRILGFFATLSLFFSVATFLKK